MIQGGPGANNWLNHGTCLRSYSWKCSDSLTACFPTRPARGARAIAGYSMGGYGAMHLALNHPQTLSAVESWLGFFNGLDDRLRADRSTIKHSASRLRLRSRLRSHRRPGRDTPAADLRAAGADAHSAVYPGEHNPEAIQEAHLGRACSCSRDVGSRAWAAPSPRSATGCEAGCRRELDARAPRSPRLAGSERPRSVQSPPAPSPAGRSPSARWRSAGSRSAVWRSAARRSAHSRSAS